MIRIVINVLLFLGLLAIISRQLYGNREWSDPDKVVDEFCGMEDLNRYHIQHHHRDLRIIVGMAAAMMVLLVADMIW